MADVLFLKSKIKYIANIYNGNSIPDDQKDSFVNKDIPYIATKDINAENHLINYENGLSINETDGFKIAKKESSLLCIEGGSAGKKIGYLNQNVAFVNKLCCIEPRKINPKFLFYSLQSADFISDFCLHLTGMIGGVNVGELKNLPISYPNSTYEQKRISFFLDEKISQIDSLIANQEKQIEKLEEYRQAVITKVVTNGLNPNAKMKDSGVEWIGEIPEDWQLPKFKNLAVLSNGKEIEREGGDIPVYGSGGIFKFTNKPLFDGVSLLTGRKGTIDNPMLVNGKFWTVDTMFYTSLIYEQFICPKYLFYAFKGCCNFKFYKSGSVLPSMTQSQINAIAIPLPCKNEQKENVLYLDKKTSILKKIILLKTRQIETLNNYKKSIIYEYVTGKKRVNS